MYLHGTLDISDNRFTGTRKSHSDVGLWYTNKTESIEIGSGSIIIRNNTTANANANVRNLYSYYGGETSEESVISIFKQKTGTKFDAINSRIDSVAINSEEYTGVIYPNWTSANVEGSEIVNFDTVFKADTYGGRKGLVLDVEENNVIIKLADHYHKICGVPETEECKHTLIGSHGIGDTDDIKKLYRRLTWTTRENLIEQLENGGGMFLMRSVNFATPATIDLKNDLYLCLGNYYIENAVFTSSTGNKAYITTCTEEVEQPEEEEEIVEYDEEGDPISTPISSMGSRRNDRNEVAIVATSSEIAAVFNLDVEVYSPYNILNIYANKLYDNEISSVNHRVALNGVTFKNDENTASDYNYVKVNANNELFLDGVSTDGLINVNNIIDATNTTIEIAGNNYIVNNQINGSIFNTEGASLNQEEGSINISDNLFIANSAESAALKLTNNSNLKGAFIATSNEFVKTVDTSTTSMIRVYNSDLSIGDELINISDNGDAFGIYSDKQAFMRQIDTTSFNSLNYIENIALVNASGNLISGAVTANDNFSLSNDVAEKSFEASTISNADYRAYKGANNNIVIGVRKLNLDFNVPDGRTLLNDENYQDEYNIAGIQEATMSKATFRIGNHYFLGWATSKERADEYTVDVEDGDVYDTPFMGNDKSQSFTLYAVWVYNPHIHKICGTATDSECNHDITHLAAHSEVIEYEPLLDTLTSLEAGKGYNLIASSSESVKRVFTIDGTVYICLNGFALYNVQFLPRSSTCKIVICNCSDHEAKVTRNDEIDPLYPGMFNHINTYIYGTGNKINFETDVIIDRSGGGYNQTVEIYNTHFSPAFGFEYTGDRALMYQENGGDRITISNSTFEGYKTTRLLSNHFNPLYTHGLPIFRLYNSSIIENTITGNGAIQNDYGTLTLENVIFEDNILSDSGHLIHQDRGSGTINIKNSYIRRTTKTAAGIGNIIYNAVGTTSIVNSTIEYNKANRIINAISGNVTIDEIYLKNNYASDSIAVSAINSAITIGNSEITENKFENKLISIEGGTVNISDRKIVNIHTNEIKITDTELDSLIYLSGTSPILNIKGNLIVKENIASGSTIKTSNAIAAIGIGTSTDPKINIGSGEIKIFNNKSKNDVSTLNHMYGIYSDIERYMYQIMGSTFNSNNYIEEIAIGDSTGLIRTGNIMANNNFTLDTSVAEKSFKASTISNAEYRAYKGASESIVIGVRKMYLDFNIPEETTLIDDEHYTTEYNIAGITKASMSKATFKVDKFVFLGWAKTIDRATNSIVDVKDGGVFDTTFDSTNDKSQEFYLYGVWRYDDDPHIHKICGTATNSECEHDIINLSSHDKIVEYKPLFDYMRNLESGRAYYLVASSSVTRTFTISGTVYICLNGFEMSNVSFKGTSDSSTVYICNCKNETVMTQNDDEYMFSDINAYVYGLNGRINLKTKSLISMALYSEQTAEFYNTHMSPKLGYINDNTGSGIVTQNNQNNIVKISDSTIEGYNTHILLLNNDSSHGGSLVGLYNSVLKNNSINGFGMIFNNHGSFVVDNTIIDNNVLNNDGHIIYQEESGIIDISSSSIIRTNSGSTKVGNMIYNDVGTINMSNSRVEYNNVIAILNEFEGNFNISGDSYFVNNSVERTIFNIHDNGTMTIEENANVLISDNELLVSENRLDSVVYLSSTNPTLDLIGNVSITSNVATGSVVKTENGIAAIGIDNSTNAKINLGSGKLIIKDNISNNTDVKNNFYGIYSKVERYMYQSDATAFNKDNYVEEIALIDSTGALKTGNIMADNNYKLDSNIVEKSFIASTISNADYRVYKGANDSIVIGVRKLYLHFNTPEAMTLIDDYNYKTEYNIAGTVKATISKATFKVKDFVFLGWAESLDRATQSIVDVKDGGSYDMPLDDTNDKAKEFNLYAVWRYDDDPHIHKICGTATNSYCDHDNIHLSTHSQIVEYKPLFDHIRTLESGKAYYLVGTASVTRKFIITGTVYICLNGYNFENVAFEGVNADSKVYISNCKNKIATVKQKTDTTWLFEDISTYIYGSGKEINFNTKALSTRGDNGAQDFIAYNAHFSPIEGYVNSVSRTAILGQEEYKHNTVLSNVTFEGYTTTILVSNNDNNRTGATLEMYDSDIKNNIITSQAVYNNNGALKLENVKINNNNVSGNLALIMQTGEDGEISIGTSSIVNNISTASILSVDAGNINLVGNIDICDNDVSNSLININNAGSVNIENDANINLSNNEVRISDTNLDSVVYMSGSNPSLNVKGKLDITHNKAVGTVTKTAKGIAAIGIDSATNPRINLGSAKLVVKDNISNNDISIRNHMFGLYTSSERFMYQLDETTFNEDNYIEEIALVDNAGNLKKGYVVADNNFTLSNEIAEKSFKASTVSDVDFRAYKGTPSNVKIGVRKVYFDINAPEGQTVTIDKIATVNMAGRVTLDIPELDIDTEECVFLGWAYEKLEVGESDAIIEKVKVVNGGTLDMPVDIDERTLYGVWKKNNVFITFEPNPPESPDSSYKNELISELKTSTVATLTELHNELLIMDSPYEITGYTFKGWALSTMSTVDADTYELEPAYQPGTILTYNQVLAVCPDRKMTLYALWVRDTYTLTLHINDLREGNGSTIGTISELNNSSYKEFNIRFDTYMSDQVVPLPTSGIRKGYNFSPYWTEEKDIAIKDRATYSETHSETIWDNTRLYRRASDSELYALWINKEYNFAADNRGESFINTTLDGTYNENYYSSKVLFDDILTLPEVKSNDSRMAFDYYGANVDKNVLDILELSEEDYTSYKTNHKVSDKFIYYEEADKYGIATLSAVYMPVKVKVIFDAKETDAAFKDDKGNYIKHITATTSYAHKIGESFVGGQIATPYRPGYKISKWVLASDSSIEITENTKWIYENNVVVEAVYELIPYTIVYMPGIGEGENYNHSIAVSVETEITPEYNKEFSKFGNKVVGFDILNGTNGIDGELTHKVSSQSETNWKKTNRVMLKDKFKNAFPSDGNVLRLMAVYDDAGTFIRYNKNTPESIDSRYTNVVNGEVADNFIDAEIESRITNEKYDVVGYEFIGWSKATISVIDADTIDPTTLYQSNQVVPYADVKNDKHILDLYAVWKRKTYNWTIHINDSREGNGSTNGSITGLMDASQTVVTIPVKFDEYFGVSVATSGVARTGYTLKGFAEEKNIAIKDKATYKDVWTSDMLVRITSEKELYALWQNKEYEFVADNGGHAFESNSIIGTYDGDYYRGKAYFDDTYILPNAKSTNTLMEFNYWGVNVTTPTTDIISMNETDYNNYKATHLRSETFTYASECESLGYMTFKAVYMPSPVTVIFRAKDSDAGIKNSAGNYVKELRVTTSYNWVIGVAFDDGELPIPYKPGYKLNSWVLASDSTIITKDTRWIYENNAIVEPIYELDTYTIVYKAGDGEGSEFTHSTNINYDSEIIPENAPFTYHGHKITGWKVLNLARTIDGLDTLEVARIGTNTYNRSTDIMIGYKARHLAPSAGNVIELEAIWGEAGTSIVYHKNTPSSIDSRYVNTVKGETTNSFVDADGTSKLAINGYDVEGYEFIGWSRTPISAVNADTINVDSLFKSNQEINYSQVRNDEFKLDLYAVWKRKTYNFTIHINDDREDNGSTTASINGLINNNQTTVTVAVKFDEKFGDSVKYTSAVRNGYTFKGFAKEKDIAIADKETYADYFVSDTIVRETKDTVLYATWMNKKYLFNADLREQSWEDSSHPDGNISLKEIYFDTLIDGNVLPNAKSNSTLMAFNYWGVNVDKTTLEILSMNETEYNNYKKAHVKNNTFTYFAECEEKGFITFTAVYMPRPVNVILDAKELDAAFKDNYGNYVRQIVATTSVGWSLGAAFDDGELPIPVRPGYKVSKWVLASDRSVEITKSVLWNYEHNTVIEPVYETVNYIVEYYPGEAGGNAKQGASTITYDTEFVPDNDVFTYDKHKIAAWKVLNSGEDVSGNTTMKVAALSSGTWDFSDTINVGYKGTNIFASAGDKVKLEAIWEESVYKVEYVRQAPNSLNASLANEINELAMDIDEVETGKQAVIANYNYTTTGYTMIGWSTKSDINYNDYVSGGEKSLVKYEKGNKVVLSNTKDEVIKLYPVWQRNEYTLSIKYPKYSTAIKKNITFRYDTYVNDIDLVKDRDYKGDAYYVLGWSLKDPGDACYSTIDEALTDALLSDYIANVSDKVIFRNQSNTLYSIARQDCIEFIYRVNYRGGEQLDMKLNRSLPQYVLNGSTKTFNIVSAVHNGYVFKGWLRDGEVIPAKTKSTDAEYYTGRVTVNPATLKNSSTYEVVGIFEAVGSKEKQSNKGSSNRGGGGGGGGKGKGIGGNFTGWTYDLVGWSYYGFDEKSSMSDKYANGIFKIDIGDGKDRYYGFDSKGYMVSGFNNFYDNTYLFNEDSTSVDYGALIFDNVIMNGKEYTIHPDYGELIGVSEIIGEVYAASHPIPSVIDGHWSGSWRINPLTAERTYVLSDGLRETPVSGTVSIGGVYYVFDKDGIMQTGFIKYRGKYYYLMDEGPQIGILYLGYKNVGGVDLLFDPILGGQLVHEEMLKEVEGVEAKVISEKPGLD